MSSVIPEKPGGGTRQEAGESVYLTITVRNLLQDPYVRPSTYSGRILPRFGG